MPDELYRKISGAHDPVGDALNGFEIVPYDAADVRRLAEWVERTYPHYLLGAKPSALAPFAHLLKEKNDAPK